VQTIASKAGALGDVVGPASATDNALARFDATTGKLIQNSIGILSDAGALSGLTGLSTTSVTDSGLTSGRVTYAGTAGLLQDDADFTFNGTTVTMANDASISGLTVGKGGGAQSTSTAFGYQALNATNTGSGEVAIGYESLKANTSGNFNIGIGYRTLLVNTTGGSNIAIGNASLTANTTASYNTGVGDSTLSANTTGSNNVALGKDALKSNTTASNNTAVGYQALTANTTAAKNIAVGWSAGLSCTTGTLNTFLGAETGTTLTTGTNNIIVGYGADVTEAGAGNQITMAYNCVGAGNNYVTFGKSGNIVYNQFTVNASWTRASDVRLKKDIKNDTLGLDFICKLRPVTYKWKPSNEVPQELTRHHNAENQMDLDAVMNGFIAQEVKQALDECGSPVFGGWGELDDGSQNISREMFIMPLINAIKELKAEVDSLKQQLGN
jgi:hypothetical protein